MSNSIYLVHSNEYKNWIFDSSHPTQGRRFNNARDLLIATAKRDSIDVVEVLPRPATEAELLRVHAPAYIDEVVNQHISTEWDGQRPDLSKLSSLFVGGTLTALDALLTQGARTAIHFPGSKHHAQYDYSSGFCIFNDFAIAADIATKDHGLRVAILDIDAHHGDGVENLTADNPMVLTYSIHEEGIFPGTGNEDYPDKNIYNFPLVSKEADLNSRGKGDDALRYGVQQFTNKLHEFPPDLIFITCGADGHNDDPLSSLEYSVEGYAKTAQLLRELYPDMPMLLGGAGGYLPDTRTPEVWGRFARELVGKS